MFKKVIEDFVCEKCGFSVEGSGFTNHCPKCLFSKHVDNDPGDRQNTCGGLMKPYRVETTKGGDFLVFRCEKCKEEKRNRVSVNDDFDEVLKVSKEFASRQSSQV